MFKSCLYGFLVGKKLLNKCVFVRGVDFVFFFSNNNFELIGFLFLGLRVNVLIFFILF